MDRARPAAAAVAIFGLGALQGAVGWWMVASGLAERVERVAIPAGVSSHARLRDLRAGLWMARRLAPRATAELPPASARRAALLVLVLLQIYLGALVAGLAPA